MKITLSKEKKVKPDYSKLGFGKYFTDHMLVIDYDVAKGGWQEPEIVPYGNFSLSPASVVFHYAQEIFEGCKAYKTKEGKITMFRLKDNIIRMNKSAARLCMPALPVEETVKCIEQLVLTEADWIPTDEGTSLYVRPTMIATEPFLGVHPSSEFKFFVILSPVGSYYANGLQPIKINVESKYLRASAGGTGESKCGGNYAASLLAAENAKKDGFSQVLYLDSVEQKYIEEVGAMNMFFVIDGVVATPELDGAILPGITRDSVIKILKEEGMPVEERLVSIDEVVSAYKNGKLDEAFGTGTAAVISPVGVIKYNDTVMTIGNNEIGKKSLWLYDKLTGIQGGRYADPFGWVTKLN